MFKELVDLNNIHNSFIKCKSSVNWKSSVQRYEINELYNINKLRKSLITHSYKQKPFYEFDINERGKLRHIKSLHVSDRVLQKDLCDTNLTPEISKYLIYDNGASRKGKGISFARKRLKIHLEKYYRLYGDTGYILLIDFSKYFDNINHDKTLEIFLKYIKDKNVFGLFSYLVKTFGNGKGVGIGSQVSQEIGITHPQAIDNYCKIVKKCKYYGRYMDDTYIIHNDKYFLKTILSEIRTICNKYGIIINEKKTQIVKLSKGFRFLKMRCFFTSTGKIIVIPSRKTITRERRKLRKLKIKLNENRISYNDIEKQYKSWRGNIAKFNSYKSVKNTDALYAKLFNRRISWTKKQDRNGKTLKRK